MISMDTERREINLVVDESEFPPQMKDMKTDPMVTKALGLLSLCYRSVNEGKQILIYDEKSNEFQKVNLNGN